MVRKSTKLKKAESEVQRDREMEEREITENRELSDEERLDEFRNQWFQSALPDIPPIDGYHVCWLTTTNPRDPIHGRTRSGYEPVRGSDIPGWDHSTIKSGEWEGCIGVNEMLAFKIPLRLYEMYMKENHHTQPLEQEAGLNAARKMAEQSASEQAKSRAPISFELEEGMSELGYAPEPPSFTETLQGG